MKICGIFFGALAYNSAYSCPSRKFMRKTCFKGKFMGEILYSGIGFFGVWNLFLGITNEITWSAPEQTFLHYLQQGGHLAVWPGLAIGCLAKMAKKSLATAKCQSIP